MGKFLKSFKFAWCGVLALFASQRNARVQLGAAAAVIAAGLVFGISRLEWISVTLCIAAVLAAEGLNSAIESLADALHPERHPLVGRAKDLAAGAVLICALGAAGVGAIIFLPHLGIRF